MVTESTPWTQTEFKQLELGDARLNKRARLLMERMAADPMASVEAILGLISVGSATPVSVDELEEALTPAEMPALRPFINALMVEIGLAVGEPTPAEEAASPSTATSTS